MNRRWSLAFLFGAAVTAAIVLALKQWIIPLCYGMTLQEFSRDILPIFQFALTFLGLISLFLVWWQIRENRLWNKLKSAHNFLDVELVKRLEAEVLSLTQPLGITVINGLSQGDIEKLKKSDASILAIKALLNDCENLCAAYQVGYIDRDLAYNVHSARILRLFKLFRVFIDHIRQTYEDEAIYIELEKTALEWEAKDSTLKAKSAAQIAKLKAAVAKRKGLQQKA